MYIIPQLRGEEKAIYLRKSQTDDPLLSVQEVLLKHEQMLSDWNERNQPEGGTVPEENIFREIGSGETISARPQIQALLRLVESPKIKAIMVTEPSRLTRGDLEDIGYIVKILRYTGTLVITLNYTFDLTDERDRDIFERELMRGNEYLEYTKKIRYNGRLQAVKNGAYIGNITPYGMRKLVVKEGRQSIHTLEPHPDEAPIVRRIFDLYADGNGCIKIADDLNREHIPGPRDNLWSNNTIRDILDNVHYLGKVRWNRRKTVRTVEDGAVKVSRPKAKEYLIFEGRHDAIIDQETWDKVQATRGKNAKTQKAHTLKNPLAGLMWCECGRAIIGREYYKDNKKRCEPRYLCPSVGLQKCGNASAKMQDVIDEVIKALKSAVEEFEIQLEAGTDDTAERHAQKLAGMEKRLEELRRQEVQQWTEKIKHGMPDHVFQKLNEPLTKEISALEADLTAARAHSPESVRLDEKLVTFRAALDAVQNPNTPVKQKNQLLKACIKSIIYGRDKYTAVGTPRGMTETPIRLQISLKV